MPVGGHSVRIRSSPDSASVEGTAPHSTERIAAIPQLDRLIEGWDRERMPVTRIPLPRIWNGARFTTASAVRRVNHR